MQISPFLNINLSFPNTNFPFPNINLKNIRV